MSKKNESNVKQRFYPLRDPENPSKVTLVPVSEEQYRALYPEIWRIHKREQYHGRCMCPKPYLWKCGGDCIGCEYHTADDITSLDQPLHDGNGTIGDYIPESKPSVENITADRNLPRRLLARLRELDPEADMIIQLWIDHLEGISDRAIARELGRPQKTFADQMKRYRTDLRGITGNK